MMARVHQSKIEFSTAKHGVMTDLTQRVQKAVMDSGINVGTVHVFNVGSTGSLGSIEFEPGLERDLPELLDSLIPPSRDYGHEQTWGDGNGHSHLQATLLGPDLTVPVANGQCWLGTWQQLFHYEAGSQLRAGLHFTAHAMANISSDPCICIILDPKIPVGASGLL